MSRRPALARAVASVRSPVCGFDIPDRRGEGVALVRPDRDRLMDRRTIALEDEICVLGKRPDCAAQAHRRHDVICHARVPGAEHLVWCVFARRRGAQYDHLSSRQVVQVGHPLRALATSPCGQCGITQDRGELGR